MPFHYIKKLSLPTLAWSLLLAACSHTQSGQAPQPAMVVDRGLVRVPEQSPLRKELVVASVEVRMSPHAKYFPAIVEADPARTVNVQTPLAGRVTELNVGLGDRVERGQWLAVIASGDMAQARADVAKAADGFDLARKGLDRARGVQQVGGNAVKDLEAAQSAYNQAREELERARTRLQSFGAAGAKGTRDLRLAAPVGGYISALNVAAGSYAGDPAATLMTVADLGTVWITANVPEADIGQIAKGQAVDATLMAFPGQIFHGQVSFVSPFLQPDSRRDMVRAVFANPDGRLKPNMFANVSIAVPQTAQVFVPESALLMNNDSVTVLVEVAPWTFQRRMVELSYDEENGTRVTKGLRAGDRVVVKGGVLLND